jgi:predicted Zn-dependent protease
MDRNAFDGQLVFRNVVVAILSVVCLAKAGDRAKAKAAYAEANKQFDRGQFALALEGYKAAIGEDPDFADAYHNLALAAEMVDRKQAIEAWGQFLKVAEGKEEYKYDLARIHARAQLLELLPVLPEAMQPARYNAEAGDYYWQVSRNSEGEEWKGFPIKVFLGSAPQMKWQKGARDAYDTWAAVIPLQLVALPNKAVIRLSWENRNLERGHAGEDTEWTEIKREGDELTARRVAVIAVDLSFNWGEDDMRAILTHELGHALGIKGHSDAKGDIMYMEMQRKIYSRKFGGFDIPFWKSLVKKPSQRDLNTLIRLYNHAGSSVRFK